MCLHALFSQAQSHIVYQHSTGIPCTIESITDDVMESTATIAFSSSNPTATFKCNLDNKGFKSCKLIKTCVYKSVIVSTVLIFQVTLCTKVRTSAKFLNYVDVLI